MAKADLKIPLSDVLILFLLLFENYGYADFNSLYSSKVVPSLYKVTIEQEVINCHSNDFLVLEGRESDSNQKSNILKT